MSPLLLLTMRVSERLNGIPPQKDFINYIGRIFLFMGKAIL